jgi:1-acyl-sn-glycerol-3-phosphate acyltransferase
MLVYGLRCVSAVVLRTWLRIYHRLRIVGRENLPRSGSFIMVCNHSSHLDALCLLSAIPMGKLHRAFPCAAQDYFFVSLRRTVIAAIFINAMPFARKVHMRQSLELCRQLLMNEGNILILFPEGTRTTTGEMGEFRPGIGGLVAGLDVPVVPCALRGAFAAWPKGALIPRPKSVELAIGKPMSFAVKKEDREAVHRVPQELRQAVQELLCQ